MPDPESADWRVVRLGETESTNTEALRRAEAGDPGRLWIVAEAQSKGRGRQGRLWVSEPGNLYSTVLLRPDCPPSVMATLSFVASLSLRQALVEVVPVLSPRLRLKWPNDLLCGGAKLAGILLESQGGTAPGAGGPAAVAVGIGVNCAHHPASSNYPTTDLSEQGHAVSTDSVFEALRRSFAQNYELWANGAGFACIRELWLQSAAGIGGQITVQRPSGPLVGIFDGLDERGALILRCEDAVRIIAAGDIFLDGSLPPASA